MERFYEVAKPEKLASECRRIWGIPDRVNIGPVNTNFPSYSGRNIKLVVICESPSFNEIAKGFPAVSATGGKIYYRYRQANKDVEGPKKYSFEDCYSLFADNGVYITNLVRCQADFDKPKPWVKNKRVKDAWEINRLFLFEELKKIALEQPNASVLFACGVAFEKEVQECINYLENLGLPNLVSYHPSRLKKTLAWHYKPDCWGNDMYFAYGSNMKTKVMIDTVHNANIVGIAKLNDKRVVLNKRSTDGSGKANIINSKGSVVWGVLYNLPDFTKLDKKEKGYRREIIQVFTKRGICINAQVYISLNLTYKPEAYESYKNVILEGAREHNLPVDYIKYLESLPSRPN